MSWPDHLLQAERKGITHVEGTEPWRTQAQVLLDEAGCKILKWRSGISGMSYTNWQVIEVPRPRTALSFAVFAHEIGHQHLHFRNGNVPRWQEEAEAWDFALAQFDGPIPQKVRDRAETGVLRAFLRAQRRGVPLERMVAMFPHWEPKS